MLLHHIVGSPSDPSLHAACATIFQPNVPEVHKSTQVLLQLPVQADSGRDSSTYICSGVQPLSSCSDHALGKSAGIARIEVAAVMHIRRCSQAKIQSHLSHWFEAPCRNILVYIYICIYIHIYTRLDAVGSTSWPHVGIGVVQNLPRASHGHSHQKAKTSTPLQFAGRP